MAGLDPEFRVSPAVYIRLAKQSQTAVVLLMASRLERLLFRVLEDVMPNLSGARRKLIFDKNGPLSSFMAKIEMAYALGLISAEAHRHLHAIRSIRNEFAHADENVHMDHPTILKVCEKLPKTGRGKVDMLTLFFDTVEECQDALFEARETTLRRKYGPSQEKT